MDTAEDTLADITEHHRLALASTRRIIVGISAGQWDLATPCEAWNVRELLNHVIAGNLWAAELAGGRTIAEVGSRLDGDQTGPDPVDAYDASAAAAQAAFEAPGALDAPCAVSYGPVPGSDYASHRFVDVLIHGWDLAAATAQAAALDPALVAACWAVVEPQLAVLREATVFGDHLDSPSDADPSERLLAALGRRVDWTPHAA